MTEQIISSGEPSIFPIQLLSAGSVLDFKLKGLANGHGLLVSAASKCSTIRLVKVIWVLLAVLITSISGGMLPFDTACITAAARSKLPDAI
ncbi:hypothetical protein D3C80_1824870 [compost metagenome]